MRSRRNWLVTVACVAAVLVFGACDEKSSATSTPNSSIANSVPTTTEHRSPALAPGQPDFNHPSATLTPGAVLADVSADEVCVAGYSVSVRDVSAATRDRVFAEYGLADADRSQYEVDHLIALELGGSNALENLWPEPKNGEDGATSKDTVENHVHDLVCAGQMSLAAGQAAIVHWDTTDIPALTTTTTTSTTTTLPPTTVTLPPLTAAPTIPPPTTSPSAPAGATARCGDGSYSFSAHRQGTCSHHGGVAEWL